MINNILMSIALVLGIIVLLQKSWKGIKKWFKKTKEFWITSFRAILYMASICLGVACLWGLLGACFYLGDRHQKVTEAIEITQTIKDSRMATAERFNEYQIHIGIADHKEHESYLFNSYDDSHSVGDVVSVWVGLTEVVYKVTRKDFVCYASYPVTDAILYGIYGVKDITKE